MALDISSGSPHPNSTPQLPSSIHLPKLLKSLEWSQYYPLILGHPDKCLIASLGWQSLNSAFYLPHNPGPQDTKARIPTPFGDLGRGGGQKEGVQ